MTREERMSSAEKKAGKAEVELDNRNFSREKKGIVKRIKSRPFRKEK